MQSEFQNMQKAGNRFQNMQNLCQYLQNLSREEFRMWRIGRFYLTLQSNYFITRTINLLTKQRSEDPLMKTKTNKTPLIMAESDALSY